MFETPVAGARVVIPSVLAQTVLIERGVIRIEGDRGAVSVTVEEAITPTAASPPSGARRFGISEDEFYEVLGQTAPGAPTLLRSFLAKADNLGIYTEFKGGMSLKHASAEGRPLNLGIVMKEGHLDTGPSTWWGRRPWGEQYNEALAMCIGGFVKEMKGGQESALRTAAGKTPRVSDLLPAHEQAWLDAIERYVLDVLDVTKGMGPGEGQSAP